MHRESVYLKVCSLVYWPWTRGFVSSKQGDGTSLNLHNRAHCMHSCTNTCSVLKFWYVSFNHTASSYRSVDVDHCVCRHYARRLHPFYLSKAVTSLWRLALSQSRKQITCISARLGQGNPNSLRAAGGWKACTPDLIEARLATPS